MKQVAVLLAPGFEEGEALLTVDILRRAGITCHTLGIDGNPTVTGSHGITVVADKILDDTITGYDMIVLPGGMPGAENLKNSERVIAAVRAFDRDPAKHVAAICAAPMVLKAAGITAGRRLTSYPAEKYIALFDDSSYCDDLVVIDGRMITSRGPATTFAFAFALVDALGGDSAPIRQAMLYDRIAK